jgi:hypothetical protein
MSDLERRLDRLEQAFGAADGPTPGQRAILDWLSIWQLTPQKRSYLQQVGREDLIERAEPLQPILENHDEQRAWLDELEGQGNTTLESFPLHLGDRTRERAQE